MNGLERQRAARAILLHAQIQASDNKQFVALPRADTQRPSRAALEWHNHAVFKRAG